MGEDAACEGCNFWAMQDGSDDHKDDEEEECVGEDPARCHAAVDQLAERLIDHIRQKGPYGDEDQVRPKAEFPGAACCSEGEPQVGEYEHSP